MFFFLYLFCFICLVFFFWRGEGGGRGGLFVMNFISICWVCVVALLAWSVQEPYKAVKTAARS